ncbi:cytochrome P450 [Exidia glandulosa HHB12029]|uniref:Cytochrome P450 n=1 Tax=Exidia glandulosa HHB12029 TaxID=1314781 RepID=A0A166A2Z4_EXIGL|nr:cytochrome P450 [Exidia glandulosa HHB12029]
MSLSLDSLRLIPSATGAALAGLAAYLVATAVYRVFFGPLAHVPGPWYAKATDAWLIPHTICMRQVRAIDELIKRYGSVVCIGPNKVIFIDPATNKIVYGGRFPKDKYYLSLRMSGKDHAMTTLDPTQHVLRRRAFAPHYSLANLASFQNEMHDYTLQLVNRLSEDGGATAFDCLTMFRHLLVDVISLTVFDMKADAVGKWAREEPDYLSTAINDWPKRSLMKDAMPPWLWTIVCHIPHARLHQFVDSDRFINKFVADRVQTVQEQIKSGHLEEQERNTLVVRMLQYKMPTGHTLAEGDIMAELQAHTMAGTDTTATTLSYLCYALSKHPLVVRTLQAELDDAMDDARRIPDMSVLHALPYLNAVISEGLRLYSAAPAPLPRVVPVRCDELEIHGVKIPTGTVVATQAWTLHKQEHVFPNPDAFEPERWLHESDDMKSNFIPFGMGPRVCGGQTLAMSMLRMTLAAVFRNFDVVAPMHTNDKSMDICEAFVIFPAGLKADLMFMPRAQQDVSSRA